MREPEQPAAAGFHPRERLETGRGGGENGHGPEPLCPHECDISRVVPRGVVLLVGVVLLLVHHHEPQIPERQEDGGSRPDHQIHFPRSRRAPDVRAFVRPQGAVVERHAPEARAAEGVQGLRREGDLGNEDQGLPAAAKRFGSRVEIHRGLSAPGDSEEKHRPELPRADRLLQRRERRALFLVQLLAPRRRDLEPRVRVLGRRTRRTAREAPRRRNRGLEHVAQIRGVVVRHPAAKLEKLWGDHEARLGNAGDLPHAEARRLRLDPEHGPPHAPRPDRNQHAQAHLGGFLRKLVDECVFMGEGNGNGDAHEGHGGGSVAESGERLLQDRESAGERSIRCPDSVEVDARGKRPS